MRSAAAALRSMYSSRRGNSAQLTGLEMKSVCAGLEGQTDCPRVLMPGHHDDGDIRKARLGAQPAAHGIPIQPGHVHIEQYDGDVLCQRAFERCLAIVVGMRDEAALRDRFAQQQTPEILIIGNDCDRCGLSFSLMRSPVGSARIAA